MGGREAADQSLVSYLITYFICTRWFRLKAVTGDCLDALQVCHHTQVSTCGVGQAWGKTHGMQNIESSRSYILIMNAFCSGPLLICTRWFRLKPVADDVLRGARVHGEELG
jgi:hypothetical protein